LFWFTISEGPGKPDIKVNTNLNSQPQYAEQLGHISVAWANLEWQLYLLFENMSGSPPAIARSIFYAIDSNRGRREMISGIAGVLLDSQSDKDILDDILRRIGKTAGQRNKYVHDTWGAAETVNQEVFQMRMSESGPVGKMQQVTLPDLTGAVDHTNKLTDELFKHRQKIAPKLPALLEKYRKLPGLGLEYAPKGHPPGRKPKGFHGRP
jgi:hypothetical protein